VKTTQPQWEEILKYLRETMKAPVREKRIRAITVNPSNHWQPKMHIEVGKYYSNLEYGSPSELVVAIFESTVFYVCTPTRGAGQGLPYLFAREDVKQVEYIRD